MKPTDSFRWHVVDAIRAQFLRRKLSNTDFSVIGNSCFAMYPYHLFRLRYSTPTIGLFILKNDYINFLENLKHYLGLPLIFVNESKHARALSVDKRISGKGYYPIGKLDDVEIHFLHYKTEVEARGTWNRRIARVNFNNLFLFFDETDEEPFKEEYLDRYLQLPYPKLFFSKKLRSPSPEVVYLEGNDFWKANIPAGGRAVEQHVDFVAWLSQDANFRR